MENMETQHITVKEVIGFSIKDLRSLSIPVDLIPTIGMTISRVMSNLESCYQAIQDPPVKKDDDFEVLEVGETDELPDNVAPISTNGGEGHAEEN